jgi:hypothetical protein
MTNIEKPLKKPGIPWLLDLTLNLSDIFFDFLLKL